MAQAIAMKAMWVRMGFNDATATAIDTVFGYPSLDEVGELNSDEGHASKFCKNIRNWEDGTGAKPYQVNMRAEGNLVKLLFFLLHMERTSRPVTPADCTMDALKSLDFQRKVENEHDASAAKVPVIDDSDWSKTLESCIDYLSQHRGITGVPLSYVIRNELKVKAAASDPRTGSQNSVYESHDQEMIARAPILTAAAHASTLDLEELEANGPFVQSFLADRLTAYNLLLPVFQGHSSLTYFKGKKSSKNCRKSFQSVWDQFLGDQMVDHLASKWENELKGMKYLGEGRNGNFDQHCTASKDLHQKLENLKQYGYQGMDERTKVRIFVQSLVHSSMENCKLHIQGKPECRQNYDKAVQVCRDFIQSDLSSGTKSLNISAVGSESGGDMSIEDQQLAMWYKWEDWKTFSKAKQQKILKLRKAKEGGKSDDKKALKKAQRKVAKLKKDNAKVKKSNKKLRKQVKVAALQKQGDDTDSSGSDAEEEDDGFPATRGELKKSKKKGKRS